MPQIAQLAQIETEAPASDIYQTMGAVWQILSDECKKHLTSDQCAALIGYRPVYFPPSYTEKPKINLPFWVWIGIGFLAGKVL